MQARNVGQHGRVLLLPDYESDREYQYCESGCIERKVSATGRVHRRHATTNHLKLAAVKLDLRTSMICLDLSRDLTGSTAVAWLCQQLSCGIRAREQSTRASYLSYYCIFNPAAVASNLQILVLISQVVHPLRQHRNLLLIQLSSKLRHPRVGRRHFAQGRHGTPPYRPTSTPDLPLPVERPSRFRVFRDPKRQIKPRDLAAH